MQPEKDLQYYREHAKELVGKEVMIYDESYYLEVLSISADGKSFFCKSFRGRTKEVPVKYPINSIRIVCSK